ncbi:MAG: class I SAM-dependent methyltransferase [Sphingomonadales bacterium]|nr:MAG: class I SAM-dependent methyltransferase [Sphingomonadales bacterium]
MGLQFVVCPNCLGEKYSPWAMENGFSAVRCAACGLLYVNPRPSAELVDVAVQTGQHCEETGGRSAVARRQPKAVARYRRIIARLFPELATAKPLIWLDVGAGYGETIQAVSGLAPAASRIYGVEPMLPKARHARSLGLDVEHGYLDPAKHGPTDYISSVNVFSHVPDFGGMLTQFHEALRPGGEVFLETGNLADLSARGEFPDELDLPDHLVFAGEDQMRQYLDRAGLDVVTLIEERMDTPLQFTKNVAKKLLGRPVKLGLPYRSAYRTLLFRARKRD